MFRLLCQGFFKRAKALFLLRMACARIPEGGASAFLLPVDGIDWRGFEVHQKMRK
jgi:hypothetical protein